MNESSRTGTRMYAPPESQSGRPHTLQGDIFALGVLLYQMVVADLARPLGVGWERDVTDELLREDIAACVDVDPQRRLMSASELATRIEALQDRRDKRDQARRDARAAVQRARMLRLSVAGLLMAALVVIAGAMVLQTERRLRGDADAANAIVQSERLRADAQRRAAESALADQTVSEANCARRGLAFARSAAPAAAAGMCSFKSSAAPLCQLTCDCGNPIAWRRLLLSF